MEKMVIGRIQLEFLKDIVTETCPTELDSAVQLSARKCKEAWMQKDILAFLRAAITDIKIAIATIKKISVPRIKPMTFRFRLRY